MKSLNQWLYADYKDNLWEFLLNENKALSYRIMYAEGKWTKENLIDNRVTGFGLFIDDSEGIHLVYSNKTGELKYCTMKDKKWVGKILYKVEDDSYSVENIKIKIIGTNMHIFYLLKSHDGSDHGIIMHCVWDGNNTYVNKLQDIILKEDIKENYEINISNNEIYLFYLSDEGDEISLNYSIYQEDNWGEFNRLYGIQGDEICFEVNINKNNINIINKSKEEVYYFLDHVIVDSAKRFKQFRIYSSKNDIEEPLIFNINNKIYSFWIEENEIYYSTFLGEKWSIKKIYNRDNNIRLEKFNAYISEIKEGNVEDKRIYATVGLDKYLYNPIELILIKDKEEIKSDNNTSKNKTNNKYLKEVKEEFYRVKEENKELEERVYHLNILLQKNQQGISNYNQKLFKALEQKRKAEENNRIFLELQKKIQNENEELINKINLLKEEQKDNELKIKEYIEKISQLKDEVHNKESKLLEKEKNIQEEAALKEAEENKNKVIVEENILIKKEMNLLKKEKEDNKLKIKEYIENINQLKDEVNNKESKLLEKEKNIQEEVALKKAEENKNKVIVEENILIKKEINLLRKEKEDNKLKIKEYVEKINQLKDEVNNVNKELLNKDKNIKKEVALREVVENKNKLIIEENLLIKKEIGILKEERESEEERAKEYIEKINRLKDEVNNKESKLLEKEKNIKEEVTLKEIVENKNKLIIEEILLIKKELELLREENKRINTELEIEKNKSVMEKLLRRRR